MFAALTNCHIIPFVLNFSHVYYFIALGWFKSRVLRVTESCKLMFYLLNPRLVVWCELA